jgi:hypothetical protein
MLTVLFCLPSSGWHLPRPHTAAIRVPVQAAFIHDAHTKWPLPNWRQGLPQHQLSPPRALAALMERTHRTDSTHRVHANTRSRRAGVTGESLLLLLLLLLMAVTLLHTQSAAYQRTLQLGSSFFCTVLRCELLLYVPDMFLIAAVWLLPRHHRAAPHVRWCPVLVCCVLAGLHKG